MAPTNDDVRRMTFRVCRTWGNKTDCICERTNNSIDHVCDKPKQVAIDQLSLGAKLPDLRMERGRLTYESYLADLPSKLGWAECSDQFKEAWSRAAEAARAAP